ncbi:MAG: hypothetical protein KBF93_00100 [Leptospiraceae bacterium]|nr:hypothetical protein [Leptospiraceae bacterium]
MRIHSIILMKPISFLLLLSLLNCVTVYTKDETILEKEKLRTEDLKEERDVYVLTHSLNSKGLYLFLDAYRVEEKSKVDFIREKYLENKDYKFDGKYIEEAGKHDPRDLLIVAAIAIPITLLILPTIPLQMMSEPQERIREEIQKDSANKIGIIPTDNIAFVLLDRNPPKEYLFKDSKVFISSKDLELDSFTVESFPYKLANPYNLTNINNRITFLKGEFNFSEQANQDKQIMTIIQKNNERKETAKCKTQYPELLKKEILPYEMDSLRRKYCGGLELANLWESVSDPECVDKINKCYEITRHVE